MNECIQCKWIRRDRVICRLRIRFGLTCARHCSTTMEWLGTTMRQSQRVGIWHSWRFVRWVSFC